MSDNANASPPPPVATETNTRITFTSEELTRYFTGVWKLQRCEICGTQKQWTMGTYPSYAVLASSDAVSVSTVSDTVTVYLRLHCANCGNTKLLLTPTIRRWLTENP